jgi:hypothetical protein
VVASSSERDPVDTSRANITTEITVHAWRLAVQAGVPALRSRRVRENEKTETCAGGERREMDYLQLAVVRHKRTR